MECSTEFHSRAFARWAWHNSFCISYLWTDYLPRGQGYIETAVVEVFQQIQHGSNPSLAILAETFRSLNYCRRNKDECFLGCISLLYIWIRSHIKCEGITFTKPYLPGASPISEFCKNAWPSPKSEECWIISLQNLDQLQWMAP